MSSMPTETDEVTILETREASPSHFLLKVESFSLLQKHGIHRYESGEFKAGGYKWRLILCPNEDKTGEDKNYISVYLAISDKTFEVNAFFSIFVLNQISGNYQCSSGRTRRFMTVKSEWGISKFISKKVLKDPSNGFLINDTCVFGAEVFIVRKGQIKKARYPSFSKRLLDFAGVKDCFTLGHYELEFYNKRVVPEAMILETREASPTHFVKEIKLFLLRDKHGICRNKIGEFYAGGYKWRLTISPNEDKESKYISVYLTILNTKSLRPGWEVNAVFSIFLLNQISGSYHYALGGTRRFQAARSLWGISEFISKKVMMDPSNGFLINNNCVFGAEVFIVKKLIAMSECLSIKSAMIPFKRNWKISNFSKLEHCWTSEEFFVEGVKWKFQMYAKGEKNEERHCQAIGVYLYMIDSKRVQASFSIRINDQINNKHHKYTTISHWFSPTSNNWGWRRFMELSTLEDPKNGFIIKDCCHFEMEISIQAVV